MHIVQIRGTSGSGKSWAAKHFMSAFEWQAVHKEGRKQPFYYEGVDYQFKKRSVIVLGHYETLCGGCDTFSGNSSASKVVAILDDLLIKRPELNQPSTLILMESLVLSEDVKWTTVLAERGHQLTVLFLNTPSQKCLMQLRARRLVGGRTNPIKEDNTLRRIGVIDRARRRLMNVPNVRAVRCHSEQVFDHLHKVLKSLPEKPDVQKPKGVPKGKAKVPAGRRRVA